MSLSRVEVKLWGLTVGYLAYAPGQRDVATFEYSDGFVNAPVEISPITLPNRQQLHRFDEISRNTFKGIPGIFADSLPDKYGNQLIDLFMADRNIAASEVTALDRLLYVGNRGMGALEYHPIEPVSDGVNASLRLELNELAELADRVLKKKSDLADALKRADDRGKALTVIRVGSSAGGARSKALVATDTQGGLYDGTVDHGPGFRYWMLKFDSEDNKDRDHKDPKGMTKVEYIYSRIARMVDINIPETDYMEDGGDFHYLIERFDRRIEDGELAKVHYGSWCGLAHADRDTTGTKSYKQLIDLARQLNLKQSEIEQLYRRAVFNVIGRNQDDHTKNFGFLMDKSGNWSLAPAFDMTYSCDPTGKWTRAHQIRLNNKQDHFFREDLIAFGEQCNLRSIKAERIVDATQQAFSHFEDMARQFELGPGLRETIVANLRRL
ncbi:type II toxin-antitoxin system HipA family toxin [Pseudomaricurvus alkylphenolicus]|uniref:type II toxin-antitoxin system HipA family toxin n=1 Tax=Pseudomaricurvus alkylphenolicus TaxID=1306991 RepID=UPI00141FA5EA|nr:type II toxin-antitoxin system HipA family toxin [Pseudomaricurvus alkylphenolicus]NIB38814.1 type II toxin-antitoxin system HipA family toxin [Pseudomaricurvus alkylphenolicus]